MTEGVTGNTGTSITFNGTLNPGVAPQAGTYEFRYKKLVNGAGCEGESATPAGIMSDLPKQPVTEPTAVEPNTEYTVCLAATNMEPTPETTLGNAVPFKTKALPPTIAEPPTVSVTPTEAHLEGLVNPNNQSTECHVQYGSISVSEHDVACEPGTLAGYGDQGSLGLSGLTQATTYSYQVIAKNAGGEESKGAIEHFTTGTPEPPKTEPATGETPTSATLHGVLNPRHAGEAGTYEFLYKESETECTGGKVAPEPAEAAAGIEGEAKEVTVKGLLPGTHYTFCLLVRNGAGETAQGTPVQFTTPAVPPVITSDYTTGVETKVATLHASVDPGGAETTYHFEYLTQAQFEADGNTFGAGAEKTPESASIGSDNTEHPAEASLEKLTPGTSYRYRVLASNAKSPVAGTPGPEATFATNPEQSTATAESCPNAQARTEQPYGQALPDCRAYEMVSPLDKNGTGIFFYRARAALSGEALTYSSVGSFSEPSGSAVESRYLARREPEHDRWSAQNITPPRVITGLPLLTSFEQLLFTPELSAGITLVQGAPAVPGEAAGFTNLDLADLTAGPVSYQSISQIGPAVMSPYSESFPVEEGATPDLSHVVFKSQLDLTPGATGGPLKVYEWAAGKLSQIDVPPTGTKFEHNDEVGADGARSGDAWHAVSADGLRVFFTANEGQTETGQVYVREDPEQPPVEGSECAVAGDACTVEVSASQRTDCNMQRKEKEPGYVCKGAPELDPNGPRPAFYRDANAAGTRVFFTSKAELTNDANTDEDKVANLYECELVEEHGEQECKLSDLTPENPAGAAVLGLVTAGENAGEENSYLYFVANGVLASNENANKETAQPGTCKEAREELTGEPRCNLYVAHYNGGKWETSFIAMLAGGKGSVGGDDEKDWLGYEGNEQDEGPGQHTVRVTADGATLAFVSDRSLTGYDNEPVQPGAGPEDHQCTEKGNRLKPEEPAVPCSEVYLFDAETGKLICTSCDPSGARPLGAAELGHLVEFSTLYLPRNLSENGHRLFFDTPDPLVPHDSNGKLDVYEWEARGEGSCAQAAGCTFPISDVAGDYESNFLDASANGNDVFITTADQLVPSDTDTIVDVYDARVEGGFPVTPAATVCDNGDSCKPPVSPQPGVFGPTGSATFTGLGNFPAGGSSNPAYTPPPPKKTTTKTVKCKKGRVKNKRGKCVKSKKKARKSAHTNRRTH